MRKVGILGGTFNPIHNGHLALAKAAMEQYQLDEILLMPSKQPPHKSGFAILSPTERFRITELAAAEYSGFTASDFELQREGFTYTADTLELLTREHPDTRFYFIIGGDSLVYFAEWKRPERILELCVLLAAGRAGITSDKEQQAFIGLKEKFPNASIEWVDFPDFPISSSEIRTAFYHEKAESVRQFLPAPVFDYLREQQLFSKVTYAELDLEMQRILPRKRYLHSVSVAHLCAAYAANLGLDISTALIAGILHDCAKAYSDEYLLTECEKYNLPVTDVERRNGFLLHGKVGAYYTRQRYFITDPRILSAITYHTTGKPAMDPYEKIVFLADYLEPFRTQPTTPALNEIRSVAFKNIDRAILMALENTIRYLEESGNEIDGTTLETYEYYKILVDHSSI